MKQTISPPKPKNLRAKFRVLLVDDHPITREGFTMLINQEPNLTVCGEADNAPKALELINKLSPDLAVIDISLKTMSGIELMKNIKAIRPDLPVLVMSMYDESLYAERALRAGARGYIMKNEASEKIRTAIRCVLDGELYLSDRMKGKMLHRLVSSKKEDEVILSVDRLSDREMEVFQLIGNGYSTRQIAQKLNLSVKTIDSYREHLKLKLPLENGSDLVRYAIQWIKSENV
ncbi:MAG: response regulator transcription factor [Verrucomicrobiota bacterium]|nr:response regulator transcription factor [Verrucomicrobiota bacterium]